MEKKKIKLKHRIVIAIIGAIIALVMGFIEVWNNPSGDYPEKIASIEKTLNNEIKNIGKEIIKIRNKESGEVKEITDDLGIFTWEKIEQITRPLTFENERIAKSKALLYYKQNPIPSLSPRDLLLDDLWQERYKISKKQWSVQRFAARLFKSLGIGFIYCVATLISTILLLTIIPWLWYFVLERIGELSKTIQDK